MARNTTDAHKSYMTSLNLYAAIYFSVFSLFLIGAAFWVADETVIGAIGLAVIALLPLGIAVFAGNDLLKRANA